MVMPERDRRTIEGRYELQVALGEGGMGVVWLAEDRLLQRHVAVKQLRLDEAAVAVERPSLRQQVLREARAAGRLNHPGATTVYDVVEEDGEAFIVMELVRAPSLFEVVRDSGPIDPALAARIGLALIDTLEAAHAAGIVHRDVKPGNVLITERGAVKLTDFGIAAVQGDPVRTTTGLVLGSPAYMAPEQARGLRATAAADVWSLGATLYYAVEGVGPFERVETLQTLAAVLEEPPRPPRRAGPLAVPLGAALEKDPSGRIALAELRALLEPVAAGRAGSRSTAPPPAPADTAYGPVETGPFPLAADLGPGGRGDPAASAEDGGPGTRAGPAAQAEAEDDEPGGLRDAAGRAAKELAPVVSALLAQHEARYPALRRLRTALDGDDARAPASPEPRPTFREPHDALREAAPRAWGERPDIGRPATADERGAPPPAGRPDRGAPPATGRPATPGERRARPSAARARGGAGARLRQTWHVVRWALWAAGLLTLLLVGYLAFELFD